MPTAGGCQNEIGVQKCPTSGPCKVAQGDFNTGKPFVQDYP